jgi:SNF2 family DNA or RNA helicase
MLRPDKFPVMTQMLTRFADYWTDRSTGQTKVGGLRDPVRWKEYTKEFIIRREREQVLPDLPTLDRRFQWMDLAEAVQKAYGAAFDEFSDAYDGSGEYAGQSSAERQTNILGFMSKMRHITGLSKVEETTAFIEEFLNDNDRKLTVFAHHKDVATLTLEAVREMCKKGEIAPPLQFSGDLSADARSNVVKRFREGEHRVMLASTLAAGEGINLQFCEDMVQMERQWNPANEEQCECRFIRIGATASIVTATYMVAYGTIDEFLTSLVEEKRAIFDQVMKDGKKPKVALDESSILKELADILYSKGRDRWKLMN